MQTVQVEKQEQLNGVDVKRLFETIEAVKTTPSLGSFKFRIHNRWEDCGENQSRVQDFYGCGQEMQHERGFSMTADEPAILLGGDKGANPVEHLLHAVAACVTTSMVYHAAAKGIAIEEVESSLEGDLDLRGFLGIDPKVRNGYQQIRMKFAIKANVSDEQLNELAAMGTKFSPVFDSVTKGVPIEVSEERM